MTQDPRQLWLFDIGIPAEAICETCGAWMVRRKVGGVSTYVHRRGDGRRCEEIFQARITDYYRRRAQARLQQHPPAA